MTNTDTIMSTTVTTAAKSPIAKDEFEPEPMTIIVDDAQKSSDGSFITYRVFTMVNIYLYLFK